jgi:periplasmic protein TonB
MSQTLVIRSASTTAATLLVSGLLLAALTMQFRYAPPQVAPAPPPIFLNPIEKEPTARPKPEPRRTAPKAGPIVETPAPPTENLSPPTETVIPSDVVAVLTGPVEITDPRWTRRPENLERYYPRRALDRGIEGAVTLDCLVLVSGALDCAVASETPRGWGFGAAALRISRDYTMVAAMRDGAAVEARYRMRVPFAIN